MSGLSTVPGMREAGELALSVTFYGDAGKAAQASLEAALGPCAEAGPDGSVWAVTPFGDYAEARRFSAPAELTDALSEGIALAEGVAVKALRIAPAGCELRGPGASFRAATQGLSGLRQTAFPVLPDRWAAAIRKALGGPP